MFISVEAVRWVLTESSSERSARLVFIVIASHCNDDGYCWPSVDTICELAKLSKPVVLQGIEKLVDLRELRVEKGGRGAGDTNYYYLTAFMEGRVKKGKGTTDKGQVSHEIRVNPSLPEQEENNKRVEQPPSADISSLPYEDKIRIVNQRLDDYYKRRWQTDEKGRYLISPSTGEKVYEEAIT